MIYNIDEIVKRHLLPSENHIYGFADLTGLVQNKFFGYNYGISIGRKLDNRIVDKIVHGPTPEYYSHYRQINEDLGLLTERISEELNKMVATRPGSGWIGKTDLFISKQFGPRLRLVSILLKTPVKSKSKPVNISCCGNCNICVDSCPAKASNGKLWNITVDREEFFDPWKCRNQCAEFGRTRLGMDARICGICVAVYPIRQKTTSRI
jgi:NAD-dependent dihydropyrimidine dehydrogenase PreA subunit